jgi:hypothetical protein
VYLSPFVLRFYVLFFFSLSLRDLFENYDFEFLPLCCLTSGGLKIGIVRGVCIEGFEEMGVMVGTRCTAVLYVSQHLELCT